MHLHHLVSFHSDKENCNTLTESSTSDVYPVSGYIVLESSRHQAAIPFAARAAEKAGWIITTVVSLSFHFCLSLETVFYLRVLLSQNPVEPITAPYEIVKVYRFGRRRCPTTFPNPCIFQTANLIGRAEGEVLQFIEKDMCHSRISRLVIGIRSKIPFLWRMGLVGTKRIELLTSRLSIVCSTN